MRFVVSVLSLSVLYSLVRGVCVSVYSAEALLASLQPLQKLLWVRREQGCKLLAINREQGGILLEKPNLVINQSVSRSYRDPPF